LSLHPCAADSPKCEKNRLFV